MKQIKRRGGFIFVIGQGERCPDGEICFLEDEWEWVQKIAKTLAQDPEQLRGFWETVFEKKMADPAYVFFTDYPRDLPESCLTKKAIAKKYGDEIRALLSSRRAPSAPADAKELPVEDYVLKMRAAIDRGEHIKPQLRDEGS